MKKRYYWIAATAMVAAFLFTDHRHTFLLPETLYCTLGLSSARADFGESLICWECSGEGPPGVRHPLEPFCTGDWEAEQKLYNGQVCPKGIKPAFYCPYHYSIGGGLTKALVLLTKGIAGSPYHD